VVPVRRLLYLNLPFKEFLVDLQDLLLDIVRRAVEVKERLDMLTNLGTCQVRIDKKLVDLEVRRGFEDLVEIHQAVVNRFSRVVILHFLHFE